MVAAITPPALRHVQRLAEEALFPWGYPEQARLDRAASAKQEAASISPLPLKRADERPTSERVAEWRRKEVALHALRRRLQEAGAFGEKERNRVDSQLAWLADLKADHARNGAAPLDGARAPMPLRRVDKLPAQPSGGPSGVPVLAQ